MTHKGISLRGKGSIVASGTLPRCQASSTSGADLPASFFTEAGSAASERPQPPGTAGGEGLSGRQAQNGGLYVLPEYRDPVGNDEVRGKGVWSFCFTAVIFTGPVI